MNITTIYKIFRAVLTIGKVAVPVLEEIFKKDLNRDGIVGINETVKSEE